jgi:hypothetical protein
MAEKACVRCGEVRLAKAIGKTNDTFNLLADGKEYDGCVPRGLNLGGGDYFVVTICLECGQAQGDWPVTERQVKEACDVAV